MLKSEARLREECGDEAAAYALKARRIRERINAYLEREQAAYIAAVKAGRLATAAHIRATVDAWIVREARIYFRVEVVVGEARLNRFTQHPGKVFVAHGKRHLS